MILITNTVKESLSAVVKELCGMLKEDRYLNAKVLVEFDFTAGPDGRVVVVPEIKATAKKSAKIKLPEQMLFLEDEELSSNDPHSLFVPKEPEPKPEKEPKKKKEKANAA